MTKEEMLKQVCPFLSVPVPAVGAVQGLGGQRAQGVSILKVRCMGEECAAFIKYDLPDGYRCGACS